MLMDLAKLYSQQIATISMILLMINALLHIVFAGAVARDSGQLNKLGQKPILVSGVTWSFATLLGGVFVGVVYWLMHHSKLTRNN